MMLVLTLVLFYKLVASIYWKNLEARGFFITIFSRVCECVIVN